MIKILVVDDEIDVCDFVKNFFQERNFRVFTALNGEEALRVVRKESPSIILLDIRMKEIDGIEVLRKIRKIDKDAKVIMVTAVVEQEKMDAAKKLGAAKYVTKPLVLGDLEATVMSYAKEVNNA